MPPRDFTPTPTLDPIRAITRRQLLTAIPALGLMAAGISCGDDESADTDSGNEAGDGFPRSIEHPLGATTIPGRPDRIVVATDFEELDPVLALDVRPVLFGYTNHYETGLSPWVMAAGGGDLDQFEVGADWQIDVEAIAAADPDLIIGVPYAIEEAYEALSRLAPTIATIESYETGDWRGAQRLVGRALGLEERAEDAIRETEAVIAEGRAKLAGLQDRSVMIAYAYLGESDYFIVGHEWAEGHLLADLGVTLRPGPEPGLSVLSLEQLNELSEADILLQPEFDIAGVGDIEALPLFKALPAVTAGRYISYPADVARACYLQTALSLRWAVPLLVDTILQAADGNGKALA